MCPSALRKNVARVIDASILAVWRIGRGTVPAGRTIAVPWIIRTNNSS